MKNFKKLFLVPVLALGTVTSCYGSNDTKCPEEKKCETCPTPSVNEGELEVTKGDHYLKVYSKVVKVLVDDVLGFDKKINAIASAGDTIKFTSSNTNIATVSASGQIKGKIPNEKCIVTVSTDKGLFLSVIIETFSVDKYFNFSSNTTIVGCVDDDVEELVLPATRNSTTVTHISSGGFYGLKKLKRLTIPFGYTNIGVNSFVGATSLEYISTPSSISTFNLSSGAFLSSHNSLKEWEINGNNVIEVKTLGNGSKVVKTNDSIVYAFNNPNGLLWDNEELPEITGINSYAYAGIDSLKNIEVSETVKRISSSAFCSNKNLESINFKGSLTTYDPGAIRNNTKLKEVNIESLSGSFITNFEDSDGNIIKTNCVIQYNNTSASNSVYPSLLTSIDGIKKWVNKYPNSRIVCQPYSTMGYDFGDTVVDLFTDGFSTVRMDACSFSLCKIKGFYIAKDNFSYATNTSYMDTIYTSDNTGLVTSNYGYLGVLDENNLPTIIKDSNFSKAFFYGADKKTFNFYVQTGNTVEFTDNFLLTKNGELLSIIEVVDQSLTPVV